ncbi:hypothetical protein KSP40_PGU017097 [Platanthera guangdongensis]|uniref:Uncharacterized protein n=1 Tax=Platanthera guangdongensis TaxID=2320717 RepID=A0ABR2MLN4_9ASPA
MEKPSKSRGTIMLKYLQKAATFSLTNLPHSPRGGAGDKRPAARGFSGPMTSTIPANSRQKKSNGVNSVVEEPASPKVTCIGQIKHKKKSSPALGGLRKYASGRETLSDFDWEKFAAAAAENSDAEKDEEVGNIYRSAPLVLGGGATVRDLKEKDVSIWRRRAANSAAALPELKVRIKVKG